MWVLALIVAVIVMFSGYQAEVIYMGLLLAIPVLAIAGGLVKYQAEIIYMGLLLAIPVLAIAGGLVKYQAVVKLVGFDLLLALG